MRDTGRRPLRQRARRRYEEGLVQVPPLRLRDGEPASRASIARRDRRSSALSSRFGFAGRRPDRRPRAVNRPRTGAVSLRTVTVTANGAGLHVRPREQVRHPHRRDDAQFHRQEDAAVIVAHARLERFSGNLVAVRGLDQSKPSMGCVRRDSARAPPAGSRPSRTAAVTSSSKGVSPPFVPADGTPFTHTSAR